MLQTVTIQAGATLEYFEPGDFFRLLDAADPVTLIFYKDGAEVSRSEGVAEGYAESFGASFDRFRITSATTQAVQFVSRLGNRVAYDKAPTGSTTVVGTVQVAQAPTAWAQAQKTITNASGSLLAANAARRYLLVQNNDATGVIYITLDGTAATTAKGVKLSPGDSLECRSPAPSGEIFAIGSIASNANVVVVEG